MELGTKMSKTFMLVSVDPKLTTPGVSISKLFIKEGKLIQRVLYYGLLTPEVKMDKNRLFEGHCTRLKQMGANLKDIILECYKKIYDDDQFDVNYVIGVIENHAYQSRGHAVHGMAEASWELKRVLMRYCGMITTIQPNSWQSTVGLLKEVKSLREKAKKAGTLVIKKGKNAGKPKKFHMTPKQTVAFFNEKYGLHTTHEDECHAFGLSLGVVQNFVGLSDVIKKNMGFNVMFPIGWDNEHSEFLRRYLFKNRKLILKCK